ncbi:MAG: YfcC family protein [Bacteroidota bacterium]
MTVSPANRFLKLFTTVPHPVVLLFAIIILATLMSHFLPAGSFDRVEVDGRQRVVPGSYHLVDPTPLSFLDMFTAIPKGFGAAISIIFIVLSSGIMFGVLEKSGMIENAVGTFVHKMGEDRRNAIVVILTFLYGGLGVMIGYENNIALIPIAAVAVLAIGGDVMLAAAIAVGGVTVGFGLSPINPYTVGTGHKIAEMPLFSGALFRGILCFGGLSMLAFFNLRYYKRLIKNRAYSFVKDISTEGLALNKPLNQYQMNSNNWIILVIFVIGIATILLGLFQYQWHIDEISAIFVMIAIAAGLAAGMSGSTISDTALKSVGVVAPGAFMVGLATTIKVILEQGGISDTIAFHLSEMLKGLPLYASAVGMSAAQCVINFMIPSGSGQALATLPIMIPLGDVIGLTRQTTILAFQIGDGVTNLFNPTLGGLIAMLSLCRVPFDRWLRYIMPVVGMIIILAWLFLLVAVFIEWGPV